MGIHLQPLQGRWVFNGDMVVPFLSLSVPQQQIQDRTLMFINLSGHFISFHLISSCFMVIFHAPNLFQFVPACFHVRTAQPAQPQRAWPPGRLARSSRLRNRGADSRPGAWHRSQIQSIPCHSDIRTISHRNGSNVLRYLRYLRYPIPIDSDLERDAKRNQIKGLWNSLTSDDLQSFELPPTPNGFSWVQHSQLAHNISQCT